MASIPLPHVQPTYCIHPGSDCDCPEYEQAENQVEAGELATVLSPCELCGHQLGWHLPTRRELTPDEALVMKARGEDALEYCKSRGCACPSWGGAEGDRDCGLCTHRRGWHKWKDVARAPPLSPSSTAHAGDDPLVSPRRQSFGSIVASDASFHAQNIVASPSALSQSLSRSATFASPASASHHAPLSSYTTVGSPSQPTALPARPLPPTPPTPPRPYLSTSLDSDRHPRLATAVSPPDAPRGPSPNRPALHVHTTPPQTIPLASAHLSDPAFTFHDEITRHTQRPLSRALDGQSIRSEATFATGRATTGSRYEFEEEERVGLDLAVGELELDEPGPFSKATALPASTWGGASLREGDAFDKLEDSTARIAPPSRFAARVQGGSSPTPASTHLLSGGAGGSGRIWGSLPTANAVAGPSSPPPASSPPTASTSPRSLRNAFSRRVSRASSTQPPLQPLSSSPRSFSVLSSSALARPLDSQPVGAQQLARGHSIASQASGSNSAHSGGAASISEESGAGASGAIGSVVERVMSNASGPIPLDAKTYESKNLALQIIPALDAGRFSAGQVFEMRLSLGQKVSLASFERIEIRLVGNSSVNSETPDAHDFLATHTSIFPPCSDVKEVGLGKRSFSWTMSLPEKPTCNCREPHETLGIPSSYTHQHFRVKYYFELIAKKTGRLGKSERIMELFAVLAPLPDPLIRVPSKLKASAMEEGRDGLWYTATSRREICVEGQNTKIVSTELRYQIIPSPTPGHTRIPYRICVLFDSRTSRSDYLNHAVLAKLGAEFSLSLSRRVIFSRSGARGGKFKEREEDLPALRVTVVEVEKDGARVVVDEEGMSRWEYGGIIDVPRHEVRSLVTCNLSVRYMLTARAPASTGIDQAIEVQARGVNLEFLPVAVPATSPTSTSSIALPTPIPVGRPSSQAAASASGSLTSFGTSALSQSISNTSISTSPTSYLPSTFHAHSSSFGSAGLQLGLRSFSTMAAADPVSPVSPLDVQRGVGSRDLYEELGMQHGDGWEEEQLPPFTPFAEGVEGS